MPYLRFSRDSRGYENTYVLHTVQEGRKVRPLMLYWSRTPPNVRVGRQPFDKDAIRMLEENNPGVAFEWNTILAAAATARADQSQGRQQTRGLRGRGRRAPDKVKKRVPEARTVSRSDGASRGRRHQDAQSAIAASVEAERESATSVQPGENPIPPVDTAPPHEEGALASVVAGDRESTQTSSEHPVVTLMGEAVLTRLRDRYAALQARIDREVSEVTEQESIRARSEALNPDCWVGLEAALKGIERFEADAAEVERRLNLISPPPGQPSA